MKKFKLLTVLTLSAAIMLTGCGASTDTGNQIKESSAEEGVTQEQVVDELESKKIIAGSVMSAELLDLLDIDSIGVVTSSKPLPERYADTPGIGLPMTPDLEAVVAMNPDIYVSEFSLKESLDKLFAAQSFEKLYFDNSSFDKVLENIKVLGEAVGKEDKAKEIIANYEKGAKEVIDSVKGKQAPSVLIIFGTPESFMVATENSYVGDLVKRLGGNNVASEISKAPSPYVPFSLETVGNINPDIVLRLTHADPTTSKAAFDKEFENDFWSNLDAVKNGEVYDLDNAYFGVTANIKLVEALEEMAKILYK